MYLVIKYSDEAWRKVKEAAFVNSLELEAMYRSRLPWPLKDFESVKAQTVSSENTWEILADTPTWVYSPPASVEAMPALSGEPTDSPSEERPLYVSDKPPKPKKKKRQVKRKRRVRNV